MLTWTDENTFEIAGNRITLDYAHGGSERKSTANDFTMMKSREFLEHYLVLGPEGYKRVMELGVYQGGSFVFLDSILKPDKISAVEYSEIRIRALDNYVAQNGARAQIHYATSQDDVSALENIVRDDFSGQIDLVVDDASHFYEPSKISFQTLFPKLRPDGLYIIEDWTWSFQSLFQGPNAPWRDQNSLVNLVIDMMEDMALAPLIGAVEIYRPLIKIRRSSIKSDCASRVFARSGRRGRNIGLL